MALIALSIGALALALFRGWRGKAGLTFLPSAVGLGGFLGSAWLLYHLRTYRLLGVLGPVAVALVAGLAAGTAVSRWLRRRRRARAAERPSRRDRIVAAGAGAAEGVALVLAGTLLAASIESSFPAGNAAASAPTRLPSARQTFAEMAGLLNRGFLCHVPLADGYGRALEDLSVVLGASAETRARAGERLHLGGLLALPAVQAVLEDPEAARAIDQLCAGRVQAVGRLQGNTHLCNLLDDPAFWSVLKRLTLTEIADAVRAEDQLRADNSWVNAARWGFGQDTPGGRQENGGWGSTKAP